MNRTSSNRRHRKKVMPMLMGLALAGVAAAFFVPHRVDGDPHPPLVRNAPGRGTSRVAAPQASRGARASTGTADVQGATAVAGSENTTDPTGGAGSQSTAAPGVGPGSKQSARSQGTAKALGVSGRGEGLLAPGGGLVPINLRFSNPDRSPVIVTSATVMVEGVSAAGCDPRSFAVVQQLTARPTLPARTSAWLSDLGVPVSSWPQLVMSDRGNQSACRGSTVKLHFAASARGGR